MKHIDINKAQIFTNSIFKNFNELMPNENKSSIELDKEIELIKANNLELDKKIALSKNATERIEKRIQRSQEMVEILDLLQNHKGLEIATQMLKKLNSKEQKLLEFAKTRSDKDTIIGSLSTVEQEKQELLFKIVSVLKGKQVADRLENAIMWNDEFNCDERDVPTTGDSDSEE